MPGKHVRFSPSTNNVFYPPLPSHSPSPSTSSLTPPPINHFGSPYSCSPLPPVSNLSLVNGPVHINPTIGLSRNPPIKCNLAQHPSSILTLSDQSLSPRMLSEPATNPPLPSLTIICHHLPWSITVHASSAKPGAFVSVSDVLSTLYRALRMSVTPAEFASLPSHAAKQAVSAAYETRWRRAGSDEEQKKGVKRIDFLMGKNRFLGLSSTPRGPSVWALDVS